MIGISFLWICLLCRICEQVSVESTEHAMFDQRQSGHYNIHISIKDVAIFDLEGNDFADKKPGLEDYYYDDDDFTIKPLGSYLTTKPTTIPPSSTSTLSPLSQDLATHQNITSTVPPRTSITLIYSPKLNESNNLNVLQQYADEIPKPMPTKKPNVMIVNTDVPHGPIKPVAFPAHMGGVIPVQIITDPVLKHKRRSAPREVLRSKVETRDNNPMIIEEDSNNANHRCRRGQKMHSRGNCRNRRSSLLGKIFHMIKFLVPSET